MNRHLTARLRGILDWLKSAYTANKSFPNDSKGAERELVVQGLLQMVFPNSYRFGTGYAMHAHDDSTTGQLDIVIETSYGVSLPISGSHVRLYPVDSVAAIIEVKSDLTKQLDEACKTCEKVRTLFKLERSGANANLHSDVGSPGNGTFSMENGYRDKVKAALWEVPFFIIGFDGPEKLDTLHGHLENSDVTGPDAIFSLMREQYVVRPRTAKRGPLRTYEGELALMAFFFDIERAVLQFATQPATLGAYAGIDL